MNKPKIYFAYGSSLRVFLNAFRPDVFEKFDLAFPPENVFIPEQNEVLKQLGIFDGYIGINPIDKDFIDAGKNLKIICSLSIGYDHINVPYATEKGIWVCNCQEGPENSTADHTVGLMIAANRQYHKSEKFLRDGKWNAPNYEISIGNEMVGKHVGLIGFGKIGQCVARRLSLGFGMKVHYFARHQVSEEIEKKYEAVYESNLNELCEKCQFISVHVPLNKETTHLIGKEQFDRMKDVIFINTSRGPIVDEQALVEALQSKNLRSVGLDVFENEPKIHPDLISNPLVTLTPHIGGSTIEARWRLVETALINCEELLINKKDPKTPINQIYETENNQKK
ncbi:glyoxylate reductase 1 [Anaeramoeba ignava]|uniref:Glyoxylate reductase 1 n=1 Tax=Anaeramoeba ignava TaxID=1746090 RepID=A0A9Q0LTS1_ANAIG|nr:glyoxylate reductase 1 [Anaeramoeba ignava]